MNMEQPSWLRISKTENTHLSDMLSFGSANYGRHTEWFLRHRDTGLRNLAAVLAAEFTITSIYFANKGAPKVFVVPILLLLVLLAIILAEAACSSCHNAFRASLENALLVTKVAWAMGLANAVSVPEIPNENEHPPVPKDLTLYVPRYLSTAQKHATTEKFVDAHLRARNNTYFWAKVTIRIFCAGAVLVGLLAAIAIIFYQQGNNQGL
jgi:hypothetical protein